MPTEEGYVNYNIAKAVYPLINCDTYGLSFAYGCDDALENSFPLTATAEWDMALLIRGREDFIGGQKHGDEVYTDMRLTVDGVEREFTSIKELTPFGAKRDREGLDRGAYRAPFLSLAKSVKRPLFVKKTVHKTAL